MNNRFSGFLSTIRAAAGCSRAVVATALCCGTALAQAEPIAVGGFEAPVLQPNSFVKNPPQSGWVFSGPSGGIQRNGSPWGAPPAPEGQQTAFLQGGNAKILSRKMKLEAGVYTVSFYAARRAFGKEVANPIMVKVNGQQVVATAISPNGTTFEKYTTPRFPLSSSTEYTVELSSTNAVGDHTTFIDRVTINREEYKIGVYYYPGWKSTPEKPMPWEPIKRYNDGEREPLLGWYDEGSVAVAESHINSMADHGIDFVVYDWYWKNKEVSGSHAVDAYLRATNNKRVQFALLWDVLQNKEGDPLAAPDSYADFQNIVKYWIDNYFTKPQYYKINGKPVVVIHYHDKLLKNALKFDKVNKPEEVVPKLLESANDMAKRNNLPGIYFVPTLSGGTSLEMQFMPNVAPGIGYGALTSYNLHFGVGPTPVPSHSYEELREDYAQNWDFNLKWISSRSPSPTEDGPVPYIIPMTSGWNLGPLGGSTDKEHDKSVSTPDTFEKHLLAARARMDSYPSQSMKTGIICCWNEFGEGSYIEPTKRYGTQYLEKVKKVFGTP